MPRFLFNLQTGAKTSDLPTTQPHVKLMADVPTGHGTIATAGSSVPKNGGLGDTLGPEVTSERGVMEPDDSMISGVFSTKPGTS